MAIKPYNDIMNALRAPLIMLLIALEVSGPLAYAKDENADAQIQSEAQACAKNTAMEWNEKLHRCVGKKTVREARHEANDCNRLTDMKKREACQLALAEKKTGISADPKSLETGNTTSSMLMNGVGVAYTIATMINSLAKKEAMSACTSKKIFGVTATAGLASDFYLKYRAKKKIKELEDKYKLDTKSNAREAQMTALEYLKEEQKTVVAIANMEKKRNLLLMAGYALAGGMAIYEMTPMGQNPSCYKKGEKTEEANKDQATETVEAKASPEVAGPVVKNAELASPELNAVDPIAIIGSKK